MEVGKYERFNKNKNIIFILNILINREGHALKNLGFNLCFDKMKWGDLLKVVGGRVGLGSYC